MNRYFSGSVAPPVTVPERFATLLRDFLKQLPTPINGPRLGSDWL